MEIPTGGFLRQWRKNLDLTQSVLADLSGLTQSVIAKVETGVVDPRASTLRKMVGALKRQESPEENHTVGDIMVKEITTLVQTDTVQASIDKMVLGGISHLPVLNTNGSVVGIVSESSLLSQVGARQTQVDEVMKVDFTLVDIDESIGEARRLLLDCEILLVCSKGELVGLVSRIDMIRALRRNQD